MWMHQIPDARALVRTKAGVFHQKNVYRGPGSRLFAQWGTGFIRLGCHGSTSCPGVTLVELDLPFKPELDNPLPHPLVPDNDEPYSREIEP